MPIPLPTDRRRLAAVPGVIALIALAAVAIGSAQATEQPARSISVETLNDSGVTGTVSFKNVSGRTEVAITVEPGANPDMPAHIHPGTCDELTPQPKFPLENVKAGRSVTVVPATVDELFTGDLAVNIHKSNDDLKTYTACVDIN
jgi:hypothetical protein